MIPCDLKLTISDGKSWWFHGLHGECYDGVSEANRHRGS
jgi:hypothetical protein